MQNEKNDDTENLSNNNNDLDNNNNNKETGNSEDENDGLIVAKKAIVNRSDLNNGNSIISDLIGNSDVISNNNQNVFNNNLVNNVVIGNSNSNIVINNVNNKNSSSNNNNKNNNVNSNSNNTNILNNSNNVNNNSSNNGSICNAGGSKRRSKNSGPPVRPQCQECGKDFSNQSALSKHKLTHSDERRFSCQLCGKAFKRQDHLNGHMLTHRDKKPFECDVEGCEKTYCDARSLRRHKENHHSNINSTQSGQGSVLISSQNTNSIQSIQQGVNLTGANVNSVNGTPVNSVPETGGNLLLNTTHLNSGSLGQLGSLHHIVNTQGNNQVNVALITDGNSTILNKIQYAPAASSSNVTSSTGENSGSNFHSAATQLQLLALTSQQQSNLTQPLIQQNQFLENQNSANGGTQSNLLNNVVCVPSNLRISQDLPLIKMNNGNGNSNNNNNNTNNDNDNNNGSNLKDDSYTSSQSESISLNRTQSDPHNLLHQLLTQHLNERPNLNSANLNSEPVPIRFDLQEEKNPWSGYKVQISQNFPNNTNTTANNVNSNSSTNNNNNSSGNNENQVECTICKRKFRNLPALNGHMRLHGGYMRNQINSNNSNNNNNANSNNNNNVNNSNIVNNNLIKKKDDEGKAVVDVIKERIKQKQAAAAAAAAAHNNTNSNNNNNNNNSSNFKNNNLNKSVNNEINTIKNNNNLNNMTINGKNINNNKSDNIQNLNISTDLNNNTSNKNLASDNIISDLTNNSNNNKIMDEKMDENNSNIKVNNAKSETKLINGANIKFNDSNNSSNNENNDNLNLNNVSNSNLNSDNERIHSVLMNLSSNNLSNHHQPTPHQSSTIITSLPQAFYQFPVLTNTNNYIVHEPSQNEGKIPNTTSNINNSNSNNINNINNNTIIVNNLSNLNNININSQPHIQTTINHHIQQQQTNHINTPHQQKIEHHHYHHHFPLIPKKKIHLESSVIVESDIMDTSESRIENLNNTKLENSDLLRIENSSLLQQQQQETNNLNSNVVNEETKEEESNWTAEDIDLIRGQLEQHFNSDQQQFRKPTISNNSLPRFNQFNSKYLTVNNNDVSNMNDDIYSRKHSNNSNNINNNNNSNSTNTLMVNEFTTRSISPYDKGNNSNSNSSWSNIETSQESNLQSAHQTEQQTQQQFDLLKRRTQRAISDSGVELNSGQNDQVSSMTININNSSQGYNFQNNTNENNATNYNTNQFSSHSVPTTPTAYSNNGNLSSPHPIHPSSYTHHPTHSHTLNPLSHSNHQHSLPCTPTQRMSFTFSPHQVQQYEQQQLQQSQQPHSLPTTPTDQQHFTFNHHDTSPYSVHSQHSPYYPNSNSNQGQHQGTGSGGGERNNNGQSQSLQPIFEDIQEYTTQNECTNMEENNNQEFGYVDDDFHTIMEQFDQDSVSHQTQSSNHQNQNQHQHHHHHHLHHHGNHSKEDSYSIHENNIQQQEYPTQNINKIISGKIIQETMCNNITSNNNNNINDININVAKNNDNSNEITSTSDIKSFISGKNMKQNLYLNNDFTNNINNSSKFINDELNQIENEKNYQNAIDFSRNLLGSENNLKINSTDSRNKHASLSSVTSSSSNLVMNLPEEEQMIDEETCLENNSTNNNNSGKKMGNLMTNEEEEDDVFLNSSVLTENKNCHIPIKQINPTLLDSNLNNDNIDINYTNQINLNNISKNTSIIINKIESMNYYNEITKNKLSIDDNNNEKNTINMGDNFENSDTFDNNVNVIGDNHIDFNGKNIHNTGKSIHNIGKSIHNIGKNINNLGKNINNNMSNNIINNNNNLSNGKIINSGKNINILYNNYSGRNNTINSNITNNKFNKNINSHGDNLICSSLENKSNIAINNSINNIRNSNIGKNMKNIDNDTRNIIHKNVPKNNSNTLKEKASSKTEFNKSTYNNNIIHKINSLIHLNNEEKINRNLSESLNVITTAPSTIIKSPHIITSGKFEEKKVSKKLKRKPEPLYIPPHVNTCVYQSRLRSPRLWDPIGLHSISFGYSKEYTKNISPPPYTPPPMLSPVRTGSGLYWHLFNENTTPKSTSSSGKFIYSKKICAGLPSKYIESSIIDSINDKMSGTSDKTDQTSTLLQSKILNSVPIMNELVPTPKTAYEPFEMEIPETDILPHVNIGPQFQARIPSFNPNKEEAKKKYKHEKEDKLWDPKILLEKKRKRKKMKENYNFDSNSLSIGDKINKKENFVIFDDELDAYLELACSSCVPGGGRNKEYAYHLLYLSNGDIEEAITKLLDPNPCLPNEKHTLHTYIYPETDIWKTEEIENYHRALNKCDKDFHSIAKEVGTKSVKQCIQFYYLWKKLCPDDYRRLRILRRKREQEGIFYNVRSNDVQESKNESKSEKKEEKTENKSETSENKNENSDTSYNNNLTVNVNENETNTDNDDNLSSYFDTFNPSPATSVSSNPSKSEYPCKICGRIFYKIKSRSAHMKVHGTKEKS